MENSTNITPMENTVGKRLRNWRKTDFLTLKQVSEKIGISQSALSELENDKSLPSATTLAQFCVKTEMNICWLLTGLKRFNSDGNDEGASVVEESVLEPRNFKLDSMTEILKRIYQSKDPRLAARIEGFLIGVDPGV